MRGTQAKKREVMEPIASAKDEEGVILRSLDVSVEGSGGAMDVDLVRIRVNEGRG